MGRIEGVGLEWGGLREGGLEWGGLRERRTGLRERMGTGLRDRRKIKFIQGGLERGELRGGDWSGKD